MAANAAPPPPRTLTLESDEEQHIINGSIISVMVIYNYSTFTTYFYSVEIFDRTLGRLMVRLARILLSKTSTFWRVGTRLSSQSQNNIFPTGIL
jgi:hypothetical protein